MDLTDIEQLNAINAGSFNGALGLVFDELSEDRLVGHVDIGPEHHQPFGQVHGGVWCGIVETFGSIGGGINVFRDGKGVVGVTNTTDFLRPVVSGRIDIVATPLLIGRTQHLWQVEMTNDEGKLVARGQVRLAVVDPPKTLPVPGAGA